MLANVHLSNPKNNFEIAYWKNKGAFASVCNAPLLWFIINRVDLVCSEPYYFSNFTHRFLYMAGIFVLFLFLPFKLAFCHSFGKCPLNIGGIFFACHH